METKRDVVEKGKSVKDMHHLRLMSLLQELERDHGRKKTAEMLGVDRRTLDTSLDEGVLSRRIRNALEKALQGGVGSAAAEQRDRNDKLADRQHDLEGRFEELGKETRVNLRGTEDANRAMGERLDRGLGRLDRGLARLDEAVGSGDAAREREPGAGPQPRTKASLRREYPDLVTLKSASDDEETFRDAWPLIGEWRELKAVHPNEGKDLDWLRNEERLRTVELSLLEEHGMTLPPASFPLRGFDRNGQINWRITALSDTRRALKKRELLLRVGRICTFGRLWK